MLVACAAAQIGIAGGADPPIPPPITRMSLFVTLGLPIPQSIFAHADEVIE